MYTYIYIYAHGISCMYTFGVYMYMCVCACAFVKGSPFRLVSRKTKKEVTILRSHYVDTNQSQHSSDLANSQTLLQTNHLGRWVAGKTFKCPLFGCSVWESHSGKSQLEKGIFPPKRRPSRKLKKDGASVGALCSLSALSPQKTRNVATNCSGCFSMERCRHVKSRQRIPMRWQVGRGQGRKNLSNSRQLPQMLHYLANRKHSNKARTAGISTMLPNPA